MKSNTGWVIIGTGGHARVVAGAALDAGLELQGFIDLNFTGAEEEILGFPVLGSLSVLDEYNLSEISVAVAVGDNSERAKLFSDLKKKGFAIPSIIHPTAIISKYALIGQGCFINCGAIVNAGADIGDNCIINTGAIVEHEDLIGKNCHLAPGVKIAGRVSIGENSFIGIGSSVIDYVKIGHDVTVGAGSVIIKDVESNVTVVGVPGRVVS